MPNLGYDHCATCGGQKTGFTTLFCPRCDVKAAAPETQHEVLYVVLSDHSNLQLAGYKPGDIIDLLKPAYFRERGREGAFKAMARVPDGAVWEVHLHSSDGFNHLYRLIRRCR